MRISSKNTILALCVIVCMVISGYAGIKIISEKYFESKVTPSVQSQSWVLMKKSEMMSLSPSWNSNKEPSAEQRKKENMEAIGTHMRAFMDELKVGSLDKALFLYRKVIDLSNGSIFFTGWEIANTELFRKLTSIDEELLRTWDIVATSKLLTQKGITQYEVGNYFYYADPSKYQSAALYYWLLACESLDRSIELDDNALAHRYKGVVIMDIGSPTKFAIEELKKSVELNDQDDISYYKFWNAYRQTDAYDLAIENYLKGIKINDNHELMRLNLWVTYFDKWDRENGYQTYRDLLGICKEYCHVANYNMAIQLHKDNKFDEAMTGFDRAIEWAKWKFKIYRDAYHQKWKNLYVFLKYNEAVQNLRLALNDPNDRALHDNSFNQNSNERDTYYYLWSAYINLRDYNNANIYLDKAIMLFPGDEELIKLQGRVKWLISQ